MSKSSIAPYFALGETVYLIASNGAVFRGFIAAYVSGNNKTEVFVDLPKWDVEAQETIWMDGYSIPPRLFLTYEEAVANAPAVAAFFKANQSI